MPGNTFSSKRILLIAVALLLCVIVLREAGFVDLNFYKSTMSTQFNASKGMQHSGGKGAKQSWDITIRDGDDEVFAHTFLHESDTLIIVSGELGTPEFTGNYYYPLLKRFEMACRLEFTGADETDRATVEGAMDIEISAEIRGFCTRSKARSLAIEEANKTVAKYFNEQFQS